MKKDTHKGFTLIETLVALSVMMIGVVAPLTIASQSINTSRLAVDQVTATYLAQDAVEWVIAEKSQSILDGVLLRNGRCDNEFYKCSDVGGDANWLSTFENAGCESGCRVDSLSFPGTSGAVERCVTASGCTLSFNESERAYGYNIGGSPSRFTRTVYVTRTSQNPDEANVEVVVSWRSGLVNKTFTIKTSIFKSLF